LQRSAILLARVLGYIDIFDLVPHGQVYFPDLVREVAEKYRFKKSPTTLEEHDLRKGVEFLQGKAGRKPIQKFVIWDNLLVLETRASTDESKAILEEILLWGAEKFGLSYAPGRIKRFAYISDVSFHSDVPLLELNPAVANLARKTSEALSEIWQEPVLYQGVSLRVGHDPAERKFPIAPFLIERRSDVRFSQKKYFSEAPLPTEMHWEMLEYFERECVSR